ncbi:ABC transporter permease [Pseudoalteromonas peptidolytica]|uniref:Putative ABC transport system permease protein n=1 Tax=Pseudoalteromonas peptidolytica F12-50-A1 TaxID=1315280 RepID=A0A8I0MSF1_9GAMM|nr:ABC transporter permease [Pseudoalteromonas peptidolytica]MBE0344949.1 putative ABC transport system permease protein [Pseudoalteromonas peptidolytica F12-50-A1]NLR15555.1 FtsX-like permease family protein [Pseudoalteromonas peptidolytica]GEK08329.1 ABC macrolide family export system permease 2 [Pseudoalteromonas peptidolytica]
MRLGSLVNNLKSQSLISALVILLIATGLGAFGTTYSVYHVMSSNPMSYAEHTTRYVLLDDWSPDKEFDFSPPLLSYQDAKQLAALNEMGKSALTYDSKLVSQVPDSPYIYEFTARATTPDFFSIFTIPFRYGNAWSMQDEHDETEVVVLSQQANAQLFNGINSVGKTLMLDNRPYTVVGVLFEFSMTPKIYDLHVAPYSDIEGVFIPFSTAVKNSVLPHGRLLGWRNEPLSGFQDVFNTTMIWLQLWVSFDSGAQMQAYEQRVAGYANALHQSGRMLRGQDKFRLLTPSQWLRENEVVNSDSQFLLFLAIVFLLICLLCVAGLLFASYASRQHALNVYRAIGASKQYLIKLLLAELSVLTALGCLLGVIFIAIGLSYMELLYGSSYAQVANMNVVPVMLAVATCFIGVFLASALPIGKCCNADGLTVQR